MLIEFMDTYNEVKRNIAAGVDNTGVAGKALGRIHRSISKDDKIFAGLEFENPIDEESTESSVDEQEIENPMTAEAFVEEIGTAAYLAGALAVTHENAKHHRSVAAEASAAESGLLANSDRQKSADLETIGDEA